MKKILLLSSVAFMASYMSAQSTATTYNWFDAEDCDSNGWLWFDSQAKINKYTGTDKNAKIRLVSATYEDEYFEYPQSYGDPEAKGWNEANEQGGEGSKTGALILPASDFNQTNRSSVNGGALLLQFPDLAKFDLFLSVEGYKGWADDDQTIPGNYTDMYCALYGGDGTLEPKDCTEYAKKIVIYYFRQVFNGEPLSEKPQYEWLDIQNEKEWNGISEKYVSLGSGAGIAKTAYVWNNNETPLYVHGIRVYTYTNTSSVSDIAVDNAIDLRVDGKNIVAPDAQLAVYAADGTLVAKGQGSIDGSALSAGLYIVKAGTGSATKTIKVVL